MKIIADKNIYKAEEAFQTLGDVVLTPAKDISNKLLVDTGAEMLLVRSVTPVNAALLSGTQVRFAASASIGIDHVDAAYMRDNCVGFAHAPGSSADSVAEYVAAALLEICAKSAREPKSMRLGIVGVGNVGSRVCRMATALGMTCVLNDPPQKEITGSEVYRPIDELLDTCDIITLHVPLVLDGPTPTYHMVDSEFVSRMKQGAALINTSRGRVIDELSFRTVCSRLGIMVLDVFEKEPEISVETLRLADIATPHIAGYSLDGKLRGTDMIYRSAAAFFFKDAAWTPQGCEAQFKKSVIDLTASKDPIYDGVKGAYNIMNDDEQFRYIYSVPQEEQVKFFEDLRCNYRKRLEFPHFTLKLAEGMEKQADILRDLRFDVKIKGKPELAKA